MKTQSNLFSKETTRDTCLPRMESRKGSALLLTLLVVSLLLVIVLAFTVFIRLELAKIQNRQNLFRAQSNAQLAMELALGELQEAMGPDQRSSANAGLVDALFETRNPHWVGAWTSEGGFRNWLVSGNEDVPRPANLDDGVPVAQVPFSPGAQVTPDASLATGLAILAADGSRRPAIPLVDTGSVGTQPDKRVFAPTVPIFRNGQVRGQYAWWVGDEGVKAHLAPHSESLDPSASTGELLSYRKGAPNRGMLALGGDWAKWPTTPADIQARSSKLINRNLIPLMDPQLAEEEQAGFHDFTLVSAGVLSDAKNGGLRKDLSIAFEIPESSFVNSEFTRVLAEGDDPLAFVATNEATTSRMRLRNGPLKGRNTKTAINYWDEGWENEPGYAAPDELNGWVYRGPTFDQLRDHYQLYRRVRDPFTKDAAVDAQMLMPNTESYTNDFYGNYNPAHSFSGQTFQWFGGDPTDPENGTNFELQDFYLHNESGQTHEFPRIRPLTTLLAPELIRVSYTFSLQSFKSDHDNDPVTPDMWQLRLVVNPFFVLHNPYNTEISAEAVRINLQRPEMRIIVNRFDAAGNKTGNVTETIGELLSRQGYKASQYSGSQFSFALTENGSSGSGFSMKPGEIKFYTVAGNAPLSPDEAFERSNSSIDKSIPCQSSIGDFFKSGFYMNFGKIVSKQFTPFPFADDDTFTVLIDAKGEWGGSSDPYTPSLGFSPNEFSNVSMAISPQPDEWVSCANLNFFLSGNNLWFTGPVDTSDLSVPLTRMEPVDLAADPSGPKSYVGKMDLYMKPINDGANRDNNFSLVTHNPRSMVKSMYVNGGQGPAGTRGPVHWSAKVTALDFSPSPDFNNRFWGTNTDLPGGSRKVTLFEVPRSPMTSIAEFQHANISRLMVQPAYPVGNSYATPYVEADQVWWRSRVQKRHPSDGGEQPNLRYWILDNSYVFNQELFDSYYFSGVNPGLNNTGSGWHNPLSDSSVLLSSDSTDAGVLQDQIDAWMTGTGTLGNPANRFHLPAGRSLTDAQQDLNVATGYNSPQTSLAADTDMRPHNAIAAYTLNRGAFNINSTSVQAWTMLLAGLRDTPVDHMDLTGGFGQQSHSGETAFPGMDIPGSDNVTGSDDDLWNGYQSLSDAEIVTLATEIVAEIKDRARNPLPGEDPRPFTTLGEFVNRRLDDASNPHSLKGVLQAAIDRTVNDSPASLTDEAVIPAMRSHITTNHSVQDQSAVDYANPDALPNATLAGTPQWLLQSDVLEQIGSRLSARSDTFTIRTYGAVTNPTTGKALSKAWLEAVVQRDPAYINPDDHPALPPEVSGLSLESKTFGRRFRVVSMKWLNAEEI